MPTVALHAGKIDYERCGPDDGRPIVFIHGFAMGASLWRPLAGALGAEGFSCVAPTWPLGAHKKPLREEAELTMETIGAMVGELLEALELEDVVLVGNDTGGAIARSSPRRRRSASEHWCSPVATRLSTSLRRSSSR